MSINKIKISFFIGGILLSMVILPIPLMSQVMNLNPDSIMQENLVGVTWYQEGTNMITVQGEVYLFTFNPSTFPPMPAGVRVYRINHKGQLAEYEMGSGKHNFFIIPNVASPQQAQLNTNTIPFLFRGQLWHYSDQTLYVLSPYGMSLPLGNYDIFARVPIPNTEEPLVYAESHPDTPEVHKKGAFQHDSSLYFLGIYAKTSDPNYKKWCLQKYSYDNDNQKFVLQSTTPMTNIPGNYFGGFIEHIDATGRHRLLINTYTKGSYMNALGYLDATTSVNQTVFTYTPWPYTVKPSTYSSVIVGGSIKGCRTSDQVSYPALPERFTIFGFSSNHTLEYQEYIFQDEDIMLGSGGNIVLPSSMAPYTYFQDIQGTFELVPTMFYGTTDDTPDGFQQHNWIYYCDKYSKISGVRFLSDSWKYIPDSTVSSHDLSNDSIYGPPVRNLWTLVGIIDGGPPCSINWNTWNANHTSTIKPTFLKFITTSTSRTEITTTYEEQYTIGTELKTDNKHFNFGLETKFSDTYKNKVSNSTTIIKEIEKTFELNEESQELGVFIYLVPIITRYSYYVYPWWDNTLSNPVPNSLQYRFIVTGNSRVDRYRDLKLFPFNINEPNSVDLADWRYNDRTHHRDAINNSHLKPTCEPTWSSPGVGDIESFEYLTDSITEYEHKTSYEVDVSFSGKKPEAFEAGASFGNEVSYSTSTLNKTEMGSKLQISLEHLTEQSLGVNISTLILEAYWFRAEDYDWWFYDSLGTERPWYIAYIVGDAYNKITLIAPTAEEYVNDKGKLFSWQATGFVPRKFELLISSSPQVSPSSILMEIDAGTFTNYYISELPADVDELYWTVMSVTSEGGLVWSETRPLTINKEANKDDSKCDLTAIPFPNPLSGSNLRLLVDTKEKGEVLVRIYAIDGSLVYQSFMNHASQGVQTYELSHLNLSRGFYIMEVIINDEHAAKKLTVIE